MDILELMKLIKYPFAKPLNYAREKERYYVIAEDLSLYPHTYTAYGVDKNLRILERDFHELEKNEH
jgi:hypothetical protein